MPSEKNNQNSRRDFLKKIALGTTFLTLTGKSFAKNPEPEKTKEMLVYIGTYTSGKSLSEGIYIYKLNLDSGELAPYRIVKNVVEPSYLAIDESRKFLYAVNETEVYEDKKSGAVSAFAIDQKTGDLQFLNKQASLGGAPCYITVSDDEKFVLVANYLGGNASVFPIQSDGSIGASVELKQNSGIGPNKARQEASHAHSINLDSHDKFAYLCDLGLDKIFIYEFDRKNGKLNPNTKQDFFQTKPGAGPRHFTFHPKKDFAYVINELDSTITALARDEDAGTLTAIETVPTLPSDFKGENTCADIHITPDGNFLYGSNRGHDSIVSFKIDEKTGRLEFIEHTSTRGKTPRNFAIDPSGKFLLAANQNSNSVAVFRIDEKSGKLTAVGNPVSVPMPVCLKLIKPFS